MNSPTPAEAGRQRDEQGGHGDTRHGDGVRAVADRVTDHYRTPSPHAEPAVGGVGPPELGM